VRTGGELELERREARAGPIDRDAGAGEPGAAGADAG
jgi:hypothetical protein